MPIQVPPFTQYQAPLIPISGRWNKAPPEGDKFIPVEIDWTGAVGNAVQLQLNSGPVEFSQVVALAVDNSRCGSDAQFLFPDTGKQLTVSAYCQGVYPVFTNSLTFYVVAAGAIAGDVTVFEILNSEPLPIAILPTQAQQSRASPTVDLGNGATTQVVPAGVSGTMQGFQITLSLMNATGTRQSCVLTVTDGSTPAVGLYNTYINIPPNSSQSYSITQQGLRLRFSNGVKLIVGATNIAVNTSFCTFNLFYSSP